MTSDIAASPVKMLRRLTRWGRSVRLERKLAVTLLVAALLSGFATYLALTGAFGIAPKPDTILLLLLLNLVVLLLLGTLVARRLVMLWMERRSGLAGARLHARLVLLFSLVAVTPTIIVATFSALFLNLGMEAWFSERVQTAVRDSLIVAKAYLEEHQQRIGAEALAMANDLRREGPILLTNRQRVEQVMELQSTLRSLTEAVIIDEERQILAHAGYSLMLEFDLDLPEWALDRARRGEVVVLPSDTEDRVRALVRLDDYADTFLYVGRVVDGRVLNHLDKTEGAAQLYERLEGQRSGLQITFALIFFIVALLLLFAAIWVALIFATQLVRPISSLFAAAQQVSTGDLSVRVREGSKNDEIGSLSRAFNRMAAQLESQRGDLIDANRRLEERSRFTKLVLSGVSAGVIGLDVHGRINLPNRSASELLGTDLGSMVGQDLAAVTPEMAELVEAARVRPNRVATSQIRLLRGAHTRTLLVRVVAEVGEAGLRGFVVTFDDVTELLSAQRKAAWADVARRIAHEIKNPLTPIQLSAERLKRKYLKEIKSDPETFTVCTDTIVRQVGDIGRMVDEFSSFARMPSPVIRPENLVHLCQQAIFLQQSAHPKIAYSMEFPDGPVAVPCDARQVGQALTNLLQNAADSIEARKKRPDTPLPVGQVLVRITQEPEQVVVAVEDNGRGLPAQERERLTEPYVTTRAKGTGLGLAIVKKIMEDHGGDLILDDRDGGGASVRLVFRAAAAPIETEDPLPERQTEPLAHGV
ncbi:ATP-binding protein [Virgifigura deserti]|uniref:sensor histidine kinase NtrY-like n=1 Tax=Virgifigura deserti TaxID=2268457 RepID=UPI003CCC2A3F